VFDLISDYVSVNSVRTSQAARIGVDPMPPSATPYAPYRGYTNRGRGRGGRAGYFANRGRGGPPRANRTLDLRPKTLHVKGVGTDEQKLVAAREFYEVRMDRLLGCLRTPFEGLH
jgi:hypothetical protein